MRDMQYHCAESMRTAAAPQCFDARVNKTNRPRVIRFERRCFCATASQPLSPPKPLAISMTLISVVYTDFLDCMRSILLRLRLGPELHVFSRYT